MKTKTLIQICILLFSQLSFAGFQYTGNYQIGVDTIKELSCQEQGNCYILLSDMSSFNKGNCNTNWLIFDSTTAAGKSLYSLAVTAKLSQSKVRVTVFSRCLANGSAIERLTLL